MSDIATTTEVEKPKSDTVEKIKSTIDVARTLQGAIKAVSSIASGGITTNIIRIVAILLLGVGWFLIRKRVTKILIQKAKELSEYEKAELKKYLAAIQDRSDDSVVTDLEQGF